MKTVRGNTISKLKLTIRQISITVLEMYFDPDLHFQFRQNHFSKNIHIQSIFLINSRFVWKGPNPYLILAGYDISWNTLGSSQFIALVRNNGIYFGPTVVYINQSPVSHWGFSFSQNWVYLHKLFGANNDPLTTFLLQTRVTTERHHMYS